MGTTRTEWSRNTLAQAGAFVVASTLALTAAFLGIVGLLTGNVTGVTTRLPVYVLLTAIAFVAAIVTFETEFRDGERILILAAATAAGVLVLVTFGGEGLTYLVQHSEEIVASHLLFYLVSAALIATGLGYWFLQHWHELKWQDAKL